MSETAIARADANGNGSKPALTPALQDTLTIGKLYAQSGYFADAREAAQGVIKIMAAEELGLPRILGSKEIFIVNGKLGLSAGIIGSLIKRSGKYNYRQIQLDEKACELAFTECFDRKWEEVGRSRFSAEDARKAGTKNMDKYPRNMLFARALTNGARWYCPDVFFGPVYTPDELGAEVGEDGEVIQGSFQPVPANAQPPEGRGAVQPQAPAVLPSTGGEAVGGLKARMIELWAEVGITTNEAKMKFIRENGLPLKPGSAEDYSLIVVALENEVLTMDRISEAAETLTDQHGNRVDTATGEIVPEVDFTPDPDAEDEPLLDDNEEEYIPAAGAYAGRSDAEVGSVLAGEAPAAQSGRSAAAIKAMKG